MAKKKKARVNKKLFLIAGLVTAIVILIFVILGIKRWQNNQNYLRLDPFVAKYLPPGALPQQGPGFYVPRIPQEPTAQAVKIPILMYHYIEYNRDPKDTIRASLTVTPYWLEKQLTQLTTLGYQTVRPDDLFTTQAKKPIILTFDDGYRDFYTDAFPLLKKYNMKATVYIITDFLSMPNYLTIDMLKEIATDSAHLITIGAHTRHHASLPALKPEVAWEEIFGSKTALETLLNIPIKHFCYPYGSYSPAVEDLVKKAGFVTATTTLPGTTHSQDSLFNLSRIRIGDYDGEKFLKRLE